MSQEIWVTHTIYEKNADNEIQYYTDKLALAHSVMENENVGGKVQVYKCIPVDHEAYTQRAGIEIYDKNNS